MQTGRTILCVDDDSEALRALSRHLRTKNSVAITACNSREAVEAMGENEIDVAILDIMMPCRNGFDVLRCLRAMSPDLPVIFLTGLTREAAVMRAVKMGVDGFVEKPYEPEWLDAVIEAVCAARG